MTVGHVTSHTQPTCLAESSKPLYALPAGLTGHNAEVAGWSKQHRDDGRLETRCDASGDTFGVSLVGCLMEGKPPGLCETAWTLLNNRSQQRIGNTDSSL
jgi:hypothetical protein